MGDIVRESFFVHSFIRLFVCSFVSFLELRGTFF